MTVTVDAGEPVYFRYLGSGGAWFDDPDAQMADQGGVIAV